VDVFGSSDLDDALDSLRELLAPNREARPMTRSKLVGITAVTLLWGMTLPAHATPPMLKQAKDAGLPAKNCQYCHAVAVPKKETFKLDELNDRGKWLMTEKDKTKAKDIDAGWLKNYPGAK